MTTWPKSSDELDVQVLTGVADRSLTLWGWFESHSGDDPQPGPHVALHGLGQTGSLTSLVVRVDQIPALVAGLTHLAARLAVKWEQEGADYWSTPGPAPAT